MDVMNEYTLDFKVRMDFCIYYCIVIRKHLGKKIFIAYTLFAKMETDK